MSNALAERPIEAIANVTPEQLELVKRTIAQGATADELKLYLYDCVRQGVHPMDRLIHFTKRGGKYTPITSIDFMRIRAAETNEYAGSDDAAFLLSEVKHPEEAKVTVWRLVQGQRCAFTATARWSEYYPGDQGGMMWRKMPHTMLAKCAEALALRKGFPRQLAGLYAKEEMDQADKGGYTVTPPAPVTSRRTEDIPGDPLGAVVGRPTVLGPPGVPLMPPADGPDRIDGSLYIERVDVRDTKNPNVKKHLIVLSDGRELSTINPGLAALAEQCCQERVAVEVQSKASKWGEDLTGLERAAMQIDHSAPVDEKDLPF